MNLSKLSWKIPSGLFQTIYSLPLWQKAAIYLGAMVIPIGLFWFFFLDARLDEMNTMSGKIPQLEQEVAKLEAKSKQIPAMEEELKTMEGMLQKAVKLLPEKEDIPSVLTEISSLGNESRLDFMSFKPQNEQSMTFYAAIPVKMEFNGPFHNTVGFFDDIGRMDRIVHIKQVSMGKAKQIAKVWSQKGSPTGAQGPKSAAAGVPGPGSGQSSSEGKGIRQGSNLQINIKCQAMTYRFLSPEEQRQAQEKNKKKKKGRR